MSARQYVRLSPNWVETQDPNTGRTYYANTSTKETRWQKPEAEIEADLQAAESKTAGGSGAKKKHPDDKWVERQDPRSGRTFYYNKFLKETSWHRPEDVLSTDVHTREEAKGAWVERVDPRTGRTFYFNRVLQRTSWVNPDAEEQQPAVQTQKMNPLKRLSQQMGRLSGAFSRRSNGGQVSDVTRNSANYSAATPAMPINRNQNRVSLRLVPDSNPLDQNSSAQKDDGDRFANLRALQTMKPQKRLSLVQNTGPVGKAALLINLEEELKSVNMNHPLAGFEQYGAAHFNRIRKGFMSKREIPLQQLIFYQNQPIKAPLHLMNNGELTDDALLAFKLLLMYSGEMRSKKASDVLAQEFAAIGTNTDPMLQIELFSQLLKQSTKNTNISSLELVWELFALLAACTPVAEILKPYVLSHLKTTAEQPATENIAKLARYALLKIERFVPRAEPPSLQEIAAVRTITPVDLKVQLISAPSLNLQVDSWLTIKDVKSSIEANFQIKDGTPFALFEVNREGGERVLDDNDSILDLVAYWERLGGGFECWYKMRLFFDISEDDTAAIELAYLQSVSEVLCEQYPYSEEDAIILAAIEAQEKFGDFNGNDVFGDNLAGYIAPKYYHPEIAETTKNRIFAKYETLQGADKLTCMVNYLNYVKQWKYYGACYYLAKPLVLKLLGLEFPEVVYLGINAKGVLIIEPSTLNLVTEYPYSEVVTWGHSASNFVLVIGNMVRSNKLFFHTDDGQEMNSLITTYVHKLMEAQTEEEKDQLMMQQFADP